MSIFESPNWYRALTLRERVTLLRSRSPNDSGLSLGSFSTGEDDPRTVVLASLMDGASENHLTCSEIPPDELILAARLPAEVIQSLSPAPPLWLKELSRVFEPVALDPVFAPKRNGIHAFLNLIAPLLADAYTRLARSIEVELDGHTRHPVDESAVVAQCARNLEPRLLGLISRTLVLEMNVARLQGTLDGETGEERFRHYAHGLNDTHTATGLLHEYPVMARLVVENINYWLQYSLEIVRHLCGDWPELAPLLASGAGPLKVTSINSLGSDSHREGRTVAIVGFSSGDSVVYKPRRLKTDIHWNALLSWVTERKASADFYTPWVLSRDTYGWTAFAARSDCDTGEQIRRFYYRQGGYLALLYSIEAVDLHYENVVAAGEYPVIVDVEALFHPRLQRTESGQALAAVADSIENSVLRVGLLPLPGSITDDHLQNNLGGLADVEGVEYPMPVPAWSGIGLDDMKATRRTVKLGKQKNHPGLHDASVKAIDYTEDIVDGFQAVYRLMSSHRDDLLTEDGPLQAFAGDETRAVLRSTRIYGAILRDSFHPDVLRDAFDRDLVLAHLSGRSRRGQNMGAVVCSEYHDLQRCDIPLFTTRPQERGLRDSTGRLEPNFFAESGLNRSRSRLGQLDENDLARQVWLIRASLSCSSASEGEVDSATHRLPVTPKGTDSQSGEATSLEEKSLELARVVGDRLEQLALVRGNNANWLTLSRMSTDTWRVIPAGIDLYNGVAGISLFLAYLFEATGDDRYRELAERAVLNLELQIREAEPSRIGIGGFEGLGGVLYTLSHVASLWDSSELIRWANELVGMIPERIAQDRTLDLIDGAAGCIAGLRALLSVSPSERIVSVAIACGDHLLNKAVFANGYLTWPAERMGGQALTGFAHGAAGFAWALMELAKLSGRSRFHEAALSVLEYERHVYSAREMNWPDLRSVDHLQSEGQRSNPSFGVAWCHGAAGIGLSRLSMLPAHDATTLRAEIETALRTTRRRGFGFNHSLCHGDMGNLELFVVANESFGGRRRASEVETLARRIILDIEQRGWLTGNPLHVETPGLMTGIAGIGYGLLRLWNSAQVPSMLSLALPLRQPTNGKLKG